MQGEQHKPVPDGVRAGETFLEHHKYDDAERYFHAVLSKDGRQARALNGLGICYQERDRNLDQAISFFRDAVSADPGYVKARKNLIVALLERDRPYEAMDEYMAGIKHDPRNGRLRLDYADLLATKLRFSEVINQARAALDCAVAAQDAALFEDCLQLLRQLKTSDGKALAAEYGSKRPRAPSNTRPLFALAAAGALLLSGYLYLSLRPQAKNAPDLLCERFKAGARTLDLEQAIRALQIARAAVYDPTGKILFDKMAADMGAEDWTRFKELVTTLPAGRAAFGSPPSVSVNRWCTIEFGSGKVAQATAHAHAL